MKGQLFLDRSATWWGHSIIDEGAIIIVGAYSFIGEVYWALNTTRIGTDCTLGNVSYMKNVTIGNNVKIGSGSSLSNTEIGDNVTIGDGFRAQSHSKVFSGARIGKDIRLGVDAHIYGEVIIGNHTCIGDHARVHQNMPNYSYINADGVVHEVHPDNFDRVNRQNGNCIEIVQYALPLSPL